MISQERKSIIVNMVGEKIKDITNGAYGYQSALESCGVSKSDICKVLAHEEGDLHPAYNVDSVMRSMCHYIMLNRPSNVTAEKSLINVGLTEDEAHDMVSYFMAIN